MMRDSVLKDRSYRRLHQEVDIKLDTLRELVDLARLAASARNGQLLQYIVSYEPQKSCLIFPHLDIKLSISRTGSVPLKGRDHQPTLSFMGTQR